MENQREANQQVALVTGANRGIGLEVCRQLARQGFTVLLCARDLAKGERAAARLAAQGLSVTAKQLDVSDEASAERLAADVASEFGCLNVLVNNAAIHYDTWQRAVTADSGVVREALETNTFGSWRTTQVLLPLLHKSRHGRLVNVSSEAGSLAGMGGARPHTACPKRP